MIATLASFAVAIILVTAMAIELRTGRIPNWLTLMPPILFVIVAFAAPDLNATLWQLGLGVAVFAVGLLLFFVAGFGAGAVKLMGGIALFVPLSKGFGTLIVFIVAMFACAFLIVQLRKAVGSADSKWNVLAKPVLPMSLPIGIAGLAALFFL